jgi:hypothetical protein
MCERFHCLPDTGGLLDQEANLIRMMKIVAMGSREGETEEPESFAE